VALRIFVQGGQNFFLIGNLQISVELVPLVSLSAFLLFVVEAGLPFFSVGIFLIPLAMIPAFSHRVFLPLAEMHGQSCSQDDFPTCSLAGGYWNSAWTRLPS